MWRLALLVIVASVPCAAEDRLAVIHALLVPMRTAPIAEARGATPALTNVKHLLRDWVESHLAPLQWNNHRWIPKPTVLQEELNDELSRADLFCPQNAKCWENRLGYLGRVTLEMQFGLLVVRTSAGVQICGTDDSAYIYELTDNRWRRIWQSEQASYTEKTYFPQRLVDVKISTSDWRAKSDRTEHLVVTTGVLPWCTSVWQPVYYRVWQTKSTYSSPLLLLDGSELADISDALHARVSPHDVFIEFQIIADDAMRVSEFRHYVLENGKLHRTDPVALTPQDFVTFWLSRPWPEVSGWTAQNSLAILKAWRQRYKGNNSEFKSPTRHCTSHPDLWQVAGADGGYFLVRARPPFRFTMVAASDHPWPDCTQDDPAIDIGPAFYDR